MTSIITQIPSTSTIKTITTNALNITQSTVNKIDDQFTHFIINIINFFKSQVDGIMSFIFNKNIIQTCIGLIIASQVSKLTTMLIDIIITPIIQRITGNQATKLEEVKITILGVNLQIGLFLSKLINFIIILIIIYYIWKLSTLPNFDSIKTSLDSVKPTKKAKPTQIVIATSLA